MAKQLEHLAKQYDPNEIEGGIYANWESSNAFDSTPRDGKDGYCILLPPPNVTGSLHMGHAFQHVVMDALTRYKRMCGNDVLWQVGTDHAGVGTHIVVSRILRGQGIDPDQLSREEFLEKVLEWKEVSASSIGQQMRKLGDSCDWSRDVFTLDPKLSKVVRDVFIKLYKDGLIYRGKRLVNWDPKLLTALADLEVVSQEEEGVMHYVKYEYVDGKDGEGVIIATTRPETILVDGALAVSPGDPRYTKHVGRFVRVPCTDRTIEIIEDQHVDAEFGSGCVKITAAHDFNDYEVAMRHPDKNIPIIELLAADATLNDNAPVQYRGLDRFEARKVIVEDLNKAGLLVKKEKHMYKLPRGERSGVVVEPMLSDQWYVKTEPLAKLALESVRSGRLEFVPDYWKNVYENWLTDIKDWCISRQIDWGHPIPAWHDKDDNYFVGTDLEDAQKQAGNDRKLIPATDVLDTWFSSALWPLSTLGWPDTTNAHFERYFPTSTLVTGNDIIFFWVARMVMMSEYLMKKVPFEKVYMHGLVRDKNGNKMSKSRGNVLDPLDLIAGIKLDELLAKRITPDLNEKKAKEIEKLTRKEFPDGIAPHGADALRLTFASLASHGRNINFDLGRIDGHRRMCNKLWQTSRFVLFACEEYDPKAKYELNFCDRWIISKLQVAEKEIAKSIEAFRFDQMVEHLTAILRDDFCDWYIEASKETLAQGGETAMGTRRTLARVFAAILRLAHPVLPFITAELWGYVKDICEFDVEDILVAPYPKCDESLIDKDAIKQMEIFQDLVHGCRSLRVSLGIDPGLRINARLVTTTNEVDVKMLARLARLSEVNTKTGIDPKDESPIIEVQGCKLALEVSEVAENWRDRLYKEIEQSEKELKAAQGKLANADFVKRAPAEVVKQHQDRVEHIQQKLKAAKELAGVDD